MERPPSDCPNGWSVGIGKLARFGVNGEVAEEGTAFVAGADVIVFGVGCDVSNLVIASPVGTLPDPLAFLFLVDGPFDAEGDACRDRLRGVIVADVVWEA